MTKPIDTHRSIARHLRNRRYALAALTAASAVTACTPSISTKTESNLGTTSAAVITSAQGLTAAQNAINFMVPDAVAFTKANQCLSCHRQPDTLISASISAQLLPGILLDTSAATGTGFIANLVTGNQQSDGHWTDSGSTKSMSAESLWALAGYARSGGAINVLPNVKKGLLWLVPEASTLTFPSDSSPYAGDARTYLNNDFTDSPQMFDWYLPTTQIVFATRVSLDLDTTLLASDVTTLSAQQSSYTDALEGSVMRALDTATVQQLSLTAIAMAESGRASTQDAKSISAEILARQTTNSGWADPNTPDATLAAVNTLTSGQALYALCRLGVRPRVNAAAGNGLDWLTSQQQEDGEWLLPSHNSSVSSSWSLLAVACVSNPSGTAEFNPLTANGSPSAPVSETFTTVLTITNTSSDARTASVTATGGPTNSSISISPSTFNLDGDASAQATVTIVMPAGLPASTSYPILATVAFAGANNASSSVTATFTTAIGSTPDATLTATTTTLSNPPTRADVGSSVALSAGVTDSNSQIVHAGSMTYAIDGNVFATVSVTGDSFAANWAVPSVLSIGSHTLHAAYLGSSSAIVYAASSADQIIDVEPPPPPTPVVTGVTDGSSSTNGQYNLNGTGTPGDTIAILANGVVVRTATVGPDGTWGASFALSPGAYTIGVVETGPGGPSATSSAGVTVLPTAPTVAGPASGTTFNSMVTTVSGVATPGATITVMNGTTVVGTTTAGSDGTYSVGVPLTPGPNNLTVSQSVNGQSSSLSGVTYNATPSAPSIGSPSAAASAQKSSTTTITGTTVPGATVLLLDNGMVIGSAVAGSDGSYAITATLVTGNNSLSTTSSVGGIVSAPSSAVSIRVDATPPFFPTPPVDLTAYAPSNAGIAVSWPTITAYDAQDGPRVAQCSPASGSIFKIGSTKVTCSASDTLRNTASIAFTTKVVLQGIPTLDLPPGRSIVVKTAIATGANVMFNVTAQNVEGQTFAALCSPASGSFFSAGTTKVTCTATDAVAMTAASGSFDVTVIPVPYYGVDGGTGAIAPASASTGGCSVSAPSTSKNYLGSLAALALVFAASRRRRRATDAD